MLFVFHSSMSIVHRVDDYWWYLIGIECFSKYKLQTLFSFFEHLCTIIIYWDTSVWSFVQIFTIFLLYRFFVFIECVLLSCNNSQKYIGVFEWSTLWITIEMYNEALVDIQPTWVLKSYLFPMIVCSYFLIP